MLKSLASKIVGLGAADVVAGALSAHPAGALAIRNPLCSSGQPNIGLVRGVTGGVNVLITGSCFGPGTPVTFYFVTTGDVTTQNTNATATGTVSEFFDGFSPAQWDDGFSISAIEGNGAASNVLLIQP